MYPSFLTNRTHLLSWFLCLVPAMNLAHNVGVVTNFQYDDSDTAVVFETTGAETGTVGLPGAEKAGDCVIAENFAFVADFNSQVWVLDLTAPPQLASGTNPILISNTGWDIAPTPAGDQLAVCGDPGLVSLVDLGTRAEVDTFDLGHGCNAIDVCKDGSVLVSYGNFNTNEFVVRRLLLSGAGELVDTGESISTYMGDALVTNNLECSPQGSTAIIVHATGVLSLQLSGLVVLDSIDLGLDVGITSRMNAAADRVHIRTTSSVVTYSVDPATGIFGSTPLLTIPETGNNFTGGIDTLAYDENASLLLVPEFDGELRFFDADTGGEFPSIQHADSRFVGVCLPSVEGVFQDGFESGDLSHWNE